MITETYKESWDYKLLDSGNGKRLEQWGEVRLIRPDPQAIWLPHLEKNRWNDVHAVFEKTWQIKKLFPQTWEVKWQNLKFSAKLSPFKHTGIFAEQAANWEWMTKRIKNDNKKLKILNLFGYTGVASIILAKRGCFVTHVDASKPAIGWAKENQKLNGLPENSIRWILDDAVKFVKKELRRGERYDAILMDPPAFGHAPNGKTWKFEEHFPELLADCVQLLSPNARFLLVNAYATNSSALALQNVMEDAFAAHPHPVSSTGQPLASPIKGEKKPAIESGELCLKQNDQRLISTGIFARWTK